MINIIDNKLIFSRQYLGEINIVLSNLYEASKDKDSSKLDEPSKDKVAIMLQTYLIIKFVAEISHIINNKWYPKYLKNIPHIQKYFDDRKLIGKASLIDTIIFICGYSNADSILNLPAYICVQEWLRERNAVAHQFGHPSKTIQEFIKPRQDCEDSIIDMAEKLLNIIEFKLEETKK